MGVFLAVMIVLGMGLAYSAFLRTLLTPDSPLWVTQRRVAINRLVRRELADLDRQYAKICGS